MKKIIFIIICVVLTIDTNAQPTFVVGDTSNMKVYKIDTTICNFCCYHDYNHFSYVCSNEYKIPSKNNAYFWISGHYEGSVMSEQTAWVSLSPVNCTFLIEKKIDSIGNISYKEDTLGVHIDTSDYIYLNYSQPKVMHNCDTIDLSRTFWGSEESQLHFSFSNTHCARTSVYHDDWQKNDADKYLVFITQINNQDYYGWLRMDISSGNMLNLYQLAIPKSIVFPKTTLIDTSFCENDSILICSKYIKKSGKYIDTIKTYDGIDSIVVSNVNEYPKLIVDLGEDKLVTTDDTLTILITSEYPSYLWSNGEHGYSIKIIGSLENIGMHQYNLSVTDTNGCKNSDTIVVTILPNTSIDNNIDIKYIVYPNPSSDIVRIECDGVNSCLLLDNAGRTIHRSIIINENLIELNLADLKNGIYFLKANRKNEIKTFKIVKE